MASNYDDNEELGKIVSDESVVSKFVKAGIMALAVTKVSKASSGKAIGKLLSSDASKYAAITAGTLLMSGDDDRGGDLAVASSLIAGMAGIKHVKGMTETVEGMAKVQKNLRKMDTVTNEMSLKIFNLNDKIKETFSNNLSANVTKRAKAEAESGMEESTFGTIKGIAADLSKAALSTIATPLENVKKFGLIKGIKENYKNIDNTASMRAHNSMSDVQRTQIKVASNMTMGFNKTEVYNDESGIMRTLLEKVSIGKSGLFDGETAAKDAVIDHMKKINKIDAIKGNTTFSDMGGMYTKYDEATGMMKLNISRLGSEESSNVDLMNKLFKNYETDQREALGGSVLKNSAGIPFLDENGNKVFKHNYDKLDAAKKEEGFVNYLNENGFGDFVKNNYKVEGAVTFGDIDTMFRDKTLASTDKFNDLITKTDIMLKTGKIDEASHATRIKAIEGRMSAEKYADEDILKAIHNNLDNKNLQKFVDVDESNLYSRGVKNAEVFKNFTFTNVVTKSDQFGFSDKTALDGTIVGLKALGIVEKSFVGNFKVPFARSFNTWNPLKLLETDNRIKERVANDMSKYGLSSNAFILDGKAVQHQSYLKNTVDEFGVKGTKLESEYYSNGQTNYKRVFAKQKIDIIDDNYEVAKENAKTQTTYKQLWKTYKEKGAKSMLERASNSQLNPYAFRYKKGEGMRMVKPEDSYFNEMPIWEGLFDSNLNNSKILSKMDAKGKDTGIVRRTANLILGKKGDINGRDLDINNKFILNRRESAEDAIITQLIRQAGVQSKIMLNDPAHKAKAVAEYGGQAAEMLQSEHSMYRLAGDLYNQHAGKLSDQLYKAAGDNAVVNKYLKLMVQNDNVDGSKRAVVGNVMKQLKPTKNKEHEIFMNFVEDNKEVFNKFRVINDFDVSKNYNFDLSKVNLTDMKGLTKVIKDDFKAVKDGAKFDKLSAITTRFTKFARDNDAYVSYFDKELATGLGFEGTKAVEGLETMLKFVQKVDAAKDSAINTIGKEIGKNSLITGTKSIEHVTDQLRHNIDEVGDELKNAYNLNLGYELNHLIKNDKDVKNTLGVFEALSSGLKLPGKPIGDLGAIREGVLSGDKSYAKGDVDKLVNMFGKTDQSAQNKDFKVYDFFDELNEETAVEAGKKHNTYFEGVEKMRDKKYVKRKDVLGSSMVVEDSLKAALNVRNAMDATRKFIQSFMDGNKLSYSALKVKSSNVKRVLSTSKNFGEMDSTFGLFMKTAINKVQAPLEMLGIERMTNKQLGSHWSSQYKNFFKYRYMPLAASALGYMAVDSFTDAIAPDEAGILGNGITGVATRTYATARVGVQYAAKYTGALSVLKAIDKAIPVDNGLTWMLDLTMDPEEMKDVYFNGKAIRVNKNRNWYTAGRQHGEGEEFGEYRPHLLYTMGNRTAGVYDNKIEKFFRQDFALTKYPWYILDPYKEERDAYDKFGASFPKTEQMFKDVPIFGHLLSATIGEVIKPTRYIAEEMWRVGGNMMKNPGYNPNDPNSPEFIEFKEPNKFLTAFYDAVEDYKTFSGMHGYLIGKGTEMVFGKTNPYKDKVVLESIDEKTSYSARYDSLELGGMFGTTEGIRRLLDGESLGTISINPLEQNLPDWLPDFYKKGNNPYMDNQYIMPGKDFDKTYNATGNDDIDRFKTLSMLAPYSAQFDELKDSIQGNISSLSKDEKSSFYESLGYASDYKQRQYDDSKAYAKDVKSTSVKIDKKISYNEFISGGKRYKIDNVESNFNELAERIGGSKARSKIDRFNSRFQQGSTYEFNMSSDAQYSVGKDRDGDYIKIAANDVDRSIKGKSVYNKEGNSLLKSLVKPIRMIANNAMTSDIEKVMGKKTAFNEWSQENVQAPYFRDWDALGSSFIEPYYNFSSNSLISSMAFGRQANNAFMSSGATTDFASALITAGRVKLGFNALTGGVTRSSAYEADSKVNRELQKIKSLSGEKSYFGMTGNENLSELKNMVNENDSQFLEGLINTTDTKERAKILKYADTVTSGVLQKVWNKQQELIGNGNSDKMYDIQEDSFDSVTDIGAYSGDADQARIALKVALGVSRSKLDAKKIGMINSYRGSQGFAESELIQGKVYKGYNSKSVTTSTIYPKGTININRRD
ncbi:MAG: hypothetical protein ACRCZ2_01535 [Fusobacteriaceae bacterium]